MGAQMLRQGTRSVRSTGMLGQRNRHHAAGDRYHHCPHVPLFRLQGWGGGDRLILAGANNIGSGRSEASKNRLSREIEGRSGNTCVVGPPTIFSSLLEATAAAGRDIDSFAQRRMGGRMISPDLRQGASAGGRGRDRRQQPPGLTECSALGPCPVPDDRSS